jgi:hypothetical protein
MAVPRYSLSFSDDFPYAAAAVFDLFTDLTRMHLWSLGMLAVTGVPRMYKGLVYTSTSVTAGQMSRSRIEVTEFIQDHEVQLTNNAGVITYYMLVLFEPLTSTRCRVTCKMQFSLSAGLLDEARPVIESMAEARVRGNWEMLKSMLAKR